MTAWLKQSSFLLVVFLSWVNISLAQNSDLSQQIPKEPTYAASEVVDSIYGITLYEPLNFRIGGDSVRNHKGYAYNGWKKDYYDTGELLHKGFYVDGYLRIYRNYYPNGDVERIFNVIDDFKSIMKIYYQGDILKAQVKYNGSSIIKWEEYNQNGFLIYFEEYDNDGEYYKTQKDYYDSGKLKSTFELQDKKSMQYSKIEYFEDGTKSSEGQSVYSNSMIDYLKTGTWKYYNPNGKLIKEEEYIMGKKEKETTY